MKTAGAIGFKLPSNDIKDYCKKETAPPSEAAAPPAETAPVPPSVVAISRPGFGEGVS